MSGGWRETTLGEICDEVGGTIQTGPFGSQLHESDYSPEGVPVVMPKDIIDGQIATGSVARVAPAHVERLARHKLKPGDIVYGRRGDIGRQALVRDEQDGWLCGTGCLRISLGDSVIEPLFLHYYLRQESVIGWIANQAIGATLPNLNTGILRSVPATVPPLSVQRRIADILSAYDELIENDLRRIQILEDVVRALYCEWFVDLRFPEHETVPRTASPLGPIPEGWPVRSVRDIADVFRGRSYRSVDLADEGGLPFLNLKCLARDGGFRRSGLKRYVGEYRTAHITKKGDIVVAVTDLTQERRIVARAALVPNLGQDFGVFSMDLVRLEPRPPLPKPFLYCLLRFSSFAAEVKQHANGANVLHLSPDRINDYRLAVPPTELTARFANLVGPDLELIDALENQIANLRSTRDLLLPRLLSGKLSVGEAA